MIHRFLARTLLVLILILILILSIPGAYGHDSPAHRIEALTARMEGEGPDLDLLIDRAFEYHALGDWSLAVNDFEAALRLSPNSWAALSGCAESYLKLGDWDQVASLARQGLTCQDHPTLKAPFYALLAQTRMQQEQWDLALQAWRGALKSPNPQIDWFIGESESLRQLEHYNEQVEALHEARQRNPSIVLHRAWIRALVNARQYERALQETNREIAKARWKSTWLLLRAQVYHYLGQEAATRADAQAALAEIKTRLHPDRPDPQLLDEKKQALAFLHS